MGINVGDTINEYSNSLINTTIVSTILNNPLFTAGIISLFCLFIIAYVFIDENIENFTTLCIRSTIYIFMSTLVVIFVYNKKMKMEMKETYMNDNMSRVLDTVNGGSNEINAQTLFADDEIVPVNIRTKFDDDINNFIEPENPVIADNTCVINIKNEKELLNKKHKK